MQCWGMTLMALQRSEIPLCLFFCNPSASRHAPSAACNPSQEVSRIYGRNRQIGMAGDACLLLQR